MHVVWPLMCNDDRIHADRGGMSGADRSRVAEGPELPKSKDDQRAPGLIARNSTNSRAQNLHFCRQMRRFCTWQARLALSGPALFVGCMHCQRHGGGWWTPREDAVVSAGSLIRGTAKGRSTLGRVFDGEQFEDAVYIFSLKCISRPSS